MKEEPKYKFAPFGEIEWQMYQGAEGEPEVCYTAGTLDGTLYELIIVVNDNGINLDYTDTKTHDWMHDFNFETEGKEIAKGILEFIKLDGLVTVQALTALGFSYNNLSKDMDRILDKIGDRIMALPKISKADKAFVMVEANDDELFVKFMSDAGTKDNYNGRVLHQWLKEKGVTHEYFDKRKFFVSYKALVAALDKEDSHDAQEK